MLLGLDPLFLTTAYILSLCLLWVFAMDIQTASRAIWNACGQLKERMKHSALPRPQSDPSISFSESREDASRPSTPEGRDSWSLVDSDSPRRIDTLARDVGHFSESEFLQQYGGVL